MSTPKQILLELREVERCGRLCGEAADLIGMLIQRIDKMCDDLEARLDRIETMVKENL